MTDTDPLAAAQAKWAATRAARDAEAAAKRDAEIRARYGELVARRVPIWTGNLTAAPAVVRAALNDLKDMRAGLTIPLSAWRGSLEADLPGHADDIIGLLNDAGFITIDGDTATVSAALPARSWNDLHPEPEPEPTPPEPTPTTFTDAERGIIRRALAVPAGASFAHSVKDESIIASLVARGVLEKTAEPGKPPRWVYVHPSDTGLSAADLTTVREFSAAVIKRLKEHGRDSLAGLDSKVGAELALIVKRRLDGVVIHHDGHGRWALIGGKPRLTRPEQRERAAKPKPKAVPTPAPDTVTAPEKSNAEIREAALLREAREANRKLDALLTAYGVKPVEPSDSPLAHGEAAVMWRIAVVLQALGPSLMSTVTAGYLTANQRQYVKKALANGLLEGVFVEVLGIRKPRIAVSQPPAGRTWDELIAAANEVKAREAAKRVSA